MNKRMLLSSLIIPAAMLAFSGQSAFAQSFPDQPIHMTVVWPAGGGHDIMGRLIANELSQILDNPVVVDNVVGAGGSTGMRALASAKPDGYTIGVMGMHGISQSYMNVNAPQMEDFEPLVYVSDEPAALEVAATTGIATLADYVTAMQDDPMALLNGNDPPGGNSFIFAHIIAGELGIDMMTLPYAGHGPTATALLTGEVQSATLPIPPVLEHARAGTLNVLGVASEQRHPQLPDVPTFKEQGYDFTANDFIMIVAPKGLPPEVKATLSDALLEAINAPDFVAAATNNGTVLRPGGPEMAEAELNRQIETVYPLLLDADLVADGLKR
ncbi:Bug family tripartite tricarboxylate transporter substrate binding protein [Falsirhodobacter algicola]|uniref:Tripartite tricarboxylate transporter substrate binding protein n=1 Tax=Falsirhodobacter algicola TaxID=2692330 RepID=A0A8J8MU19_9RHOB|nr:tripartite tricarboxylate transporter substrate binding protein [Falsirhodobacter algicola]QUS36737.1 tripartite tricarboxylate transporter substrate binding protein [Falsirhodobacter algicola]